jgi:hypothetical protein
VQEGGRRKEWNWEEIHTKCGIGTREGIYNYVGYVLCRVVIVVLSGGDSKNIVLLLLALRIGDEEKRIGCPSTEGRDENEMIKGQQCCESRTRKS